VVAVAVEEIHLRTDIMEEAVVLEVP